MEPSSVRTSEESRVQVALVCIDGAARGNPGPAGAGVLIELPETRIEIGRALGRRTNNQAEYLALIIALARLLELGQTRARVRTDSELLFCQMTGRYRVRNAELRELHREAMALVHRMSEVQFELVPREANQEADRLANLALTDIAGDQKQMYQ